MQVCHVVNVGGFSLLFALDADMWHYSVLKEFLAFLLQEPCECLPGWQADCVGWLHHQQGKKLVIHMVVEYKAE